MIVQAIVTLLMQTPGQADMLGGRIYPADLPDAPTYPAVVVSKASGVETYAMPKRRVGLEQSRIQVDVYGGDGYAAMLQVKTWVKDRLSGFSGGIEGEPCQIDSSFCINDEDFPEPQSERAGPRLRRRLLEFAIWHREP